MTNHGDLDDPALGGTYELKNGEVSFTNTLGGACAVGDTWKWRIVIDGGDLLVEWLTGGCQVAAGEYWTFTRRLDDD